MLALSIFIVEDCACFTYGLVAQTFGALACITEFTSQSYREGLLVAFMHPLARTLWVAAAQVKTH